MNAAQRTALYAVAAAVMPILVSFGLLTEDRAPLFLALIGAVLSAIPPVVALRHVTPDEVDVYFDPEATDDGAAGEP